MQVDFTTLIKRVKSTAKMAVKISSLVEKLIYVMYYS